MAMQKPPELICPAGTPAALKIAVKAGADAIYCGFRDNSNARNFPGLNFSDNEMSEAVDYAHRHDVKLFIAMNTFPSAGNESSWKKTVEKAVSVNPDAIIVADIGIADYISTNYPHVNLHLSVQASASSAETINFYKKEFGIKRVVLPRLFSVEDIKNINSQTDCETEIFIFGGLCVMAEGRCSLSGHATGKSPNVDGVCSPASHVRYEHLADGSMNSYLGDHLINSFSHDETACYPTICKGRYKSSDNESYVFGEPASLNAMELIPDFIEAGVSAFKIEGRQRGKSYVEDAVSSFRTLIDIYMEYGIERFLQATDQAEKLSSLSEGIKGITGSYKKSWR